MLKVLNQYSHKRKSWILISIISISLEILALFFQHVIGFSPCVLCIYERCALFGIISAGLVGAIAPTTSLRYIALSIWLYSAWKGILLSWKHIIIQLYPSPFITCDIKTNFPIWLPLDKWLPHVFLSADGCYVRKLEFLKIELSQWTMGIFILYFIISLLLSISQLYKLCKSNTHIFYERK